MQYGRTKMFVIEQDPTDRRTPIIKFIKNEELVDKAAEHLARQSVNYTLIGSNVYGHGAIRIFMRCISTSMGKHLL